MEKLHLYDKILSPILNEKTTNLSEQNKVVFKVPASANKKNLKINKDLLNFSDINKEIKKTKEMNLIIQKFKMTNAIISLDKNSK